MLAVTMAYGWPVRADDGAVERARDEVGLFFSPDDVVYAASRREEQQAQAPSVTTVITSDEIVKRGWRNLGEILRDAVGFEINDNGQWPDTGVRGVNEGTSYGEKILILLDGHDMAWRQFNRNLHSTAWVAPRDIKRVEVVRGPGSAVWGGGALLGVVNVVTWAADELQDEMLTAGVGVDHDQEYFTVRGGAQPLRDLYVRTTFWTDRRSEGKNLAPLLEMHRLGQGDVRVEGQESNSQSLLLKARYHGLSLLAHASRADSTGPLSTFSVLGGDDTRSIIERVFVMLSYKGRLLPTLRLEADLHFDDCRFGDGTAYEGNPLSTHRSDPVNGGVGVEEDGTPFTDGRFVRDMAARDDRLNGGLRVDWTPVPWFGGLLGVDAEYLDATRWHFPQVWAADPDLVVPRMSTVRVGEYAQVQASWLERLTLTAGLRADQHKVVDARGRPAGDTIQALSPRFGLTVRPGLGFFAKALYGRSFKPPSLHDLYYFRGGAFYGNPDLRQESATTEDMQLGFQREDVDLRVSWFRVAIDDLIAYVRQDDPQDLSGAEAFPRSHRPEAGDTWYQKANLGAVRSMGLEAEARLKVGAFTARADATWRQPEARGVDGKWSRLSYSSQFVAGGALSYDWGTQVSSTISGRYVGERRAPATAFQGPGAPATWTAEGDPTLAAPGYFTADFVVQVRELFEQSLDLNLRFTNLTATRAWDAGRDVLFPRHLLETTLTAVWRF
jgi:iron complex outermembrane receptor protein